MIERSAPGRGNAAAGADDAGVHGKQVTVRLMNVWVILFLPTLH
jgi:hypothetical protein